MQAGLPAFNGMQIAPPEGMWEMIDPDGEYEWAWNRLANDSCDDFAQRNVDFVLSDQELTQACLTPRERVADGAVAFYLYEVTADAP